ncbi:hypothetical protein HMPREF2531_05322 [Bacteroides intestinalis]|jgi:hypothetical protein|uniref:Uncharacterized protein n=2 Tax=Bacteroides TaxID=816 RepID=A0A139KN12_9BACE|nr:hypothetical protein HMPREF2531_05322 [Bacteroides intestinalis]DAU03835.1 MAG TPA: hypothetical protein [Caudoviricetes sp.]
MVPGTFKNRDMKKKEYTGYCVVTEDMTTALFWSGNFDACKQSCHKGNVVVQEYRKKIGYKVWITWNKWNKAFAFRFKRREIKVLWLYIKWINIYTEKWEHEIFWKPNG